jgi:magnesium chelatase subunit D
MNNLRSKQRIEQANSYPFTAFVGQEEMKLALVLNAIDPLLGGVLIMGHRGTGKSTAVRSLAELLPEISTVSGCPYRCDPNYEANLCADCRKKAATKKLKSVESRVQVVDLPLGATEDRVCGTIDLERALTKGKRSFEPGLLARANRGFLYIDEVNLLDDHLVDLLLDVAVTGINRVERESISIEHPARFVLVGSGNPEEGELRPQLLDRFGLHIEVTTENELDRRVEIVERHDEFERNPISFVERYAKEQEKLREGIVSARQLHPFVTIGKDVLRKIAALCSELNLDGHRGELTLARAGRALAAFEKRRKVSDEDIARVALMSLRHRMRRQPFDESGSSTKIRDAIERVFGNAQVQTRQGKDGSSSEEGTSSSDQSLETAAPNSKSALSELNVEDVIEQRGKSSRGESTSVTRNRRSLKAKAASQRGRYSRAVENHASNAVALDATIRAAVLRKQDNNSLVPVGALRYKKFTRRAGSLYIFVVDTSGSMATRRINRAREIAISLLQRSYLHRDNIAMVVFRGSTAEEVLPPSRSILRAKRALESLSVGGGTPLSAGVARALDVVKRVGSSYGHPTILLFTDGGANVPLLSDPTKSRRQRSRAIAEELAQLGMELRKGKINTVVISTRNRHVHDEARLVATQLGAQYFSS